MTSVSTNLDAATLFVTVVGDFTFVREPDIERVLDERSPDVRRIPIDASRMSSIDSAGMGMLLLIQHALGTRGALALVGCHGTALDALERLHLHRELQLLSHDDVARWLLECPRAASREPRAANCERS